MPGLCRKLSPVLIVTFIFIANFTPARAQDSSFQSQFSNPTHFGLAVAGISLGAAISAALIGLLVYCLVFRRRRRDRLRRSTSAAASKKPSTTRPAGDPPGATATDFGGRIALPSSAAPATNGTAGTSGSGKGGAVAAGISSAGGGGSGANSANSAKMMGQYVNPAFDATDSGTGGSAGKVGGVGLYRHSSALRPIQYGSRESSTPGNSLHSLNRVDLDRPSITHSVVHTSPMGTATRQQQQQQQQKSDLLLDPRHYLSDLNLSDRQKRLSLVSDVTLATLPHHQQQQQQLQQHQHPPASNPKRHSYAEQRASYDSSVELVSGQVFSMPAINSLPRQNPQRFPSQIPALPTQLEEGPSFPVTRAVPSPTPQQNAQRQESQQQQQQQQLPQSGSSSEQRLKSLHRIDLSGGVVEGAVDDRRSVTSTVLKQEAIQAFEFLDSYDD